MSFAHLHGSVYDVESNYEHIQRLLYSSHSHTEFRLTAVLVLSGYANSANLHVSGAVYQGLFF